MTTNPQFRRRPWRTAAVAGAALAVAVLFTGGAIVSAATANASGNAIAPPQQRSATTMVVALTQEPDSLNPLLGGFAASSKMHQLMYDYLTNYSPMDRKPIPGLAESWQISPDGLTWTFTIRTGVLWHDGRPLTAGDIAYTYNRVLRGTTEQLLYRGYVANFETVTAPNDTTLVIKTSVATATVLATEVPIIPEHIWKHIADAAAFANDINVVGSGPFQLVEYKPGEFIRLKANMRYWRGAPHLDELVFKLFKNTDAAVQALRKGEIDLVGDLTPAQYRALRNEKNITLVRGQGRSLRELGINSGAAATDNTPLGDGHPALQDQRVRLAIHHAIDKQVLVEKVLGGYATAGTSLIPPLSGRWHHEPDQATRVEFDLAKANQILDEAAYARGPSGIRRMPGGTRELRFRLYGRTNEDASVRSIEYIAGWLKQIGIEVDRRVMEDGQLNELLTKGQFDLYHWGWQADPDPDYLLSAMTCAQRPRPDGMGGYVGQISDALYCNPEYDRLYQEQARTIDETKRAEIVKQMQKMLYQDSPYIIVYYKDALEAYRNDRFTGFQLQPEKSGTILWQAGSWSYLSARPSSHKQQANGDSKRHSGAAVVTAMAVIAAGVFARRYRASAEERE